MVHIVPLNHGWGKHRGGKATGKGCPRGKFEAAVKGFCYGQSQGQHPGNIMPPDPPLRRRNKEKTI